MLYTHSRISRNFAHKNSQIQENLKHTKDGIMTKKLTWNDFFFLLLSMFITLVLAVSKSYRGKCYIYFIIKKQKQTYIHITFSVTSPTCIHVKHFWIDWSSLPSVIIRQMKWVATPKKTFDCHGWARSHVFNNSLSLNARWLVLGNSHVTVNDSFGSLLVNDAALIQREIDCFYRSCEGARGAVPLQIQQVALSQSLPWPVCSILASAPHCWRNSTPNIKLCVWWCFCQLGLEILSGNKKLQNGDITRKKNKSDF